MPRTVADLPAYLLTDIGLRPDQIAGLADRIKAAAETPLPTPLRLVVSNDRAAKAGGRPEKPLAA